MQCSISFLAVLCFLCVFIQIPFDAANAIQVEALSKDDLASRLSLTVEAGTVGSLRLSDSFITIMDVCLTKIFMTFCSGKLYLSYYLSNARLG